MGQHYVPQYYLKGFSESDDMLWAYEKGTEHKFKSKIKNIGNITNFYTPEVEE